MTKLDTQSFATVANRLEELRQLFPSCFTESENGLAVDFDQLRSLLSVEVVEGTQERYRFTWPGKRQAVANANARTSKTLRPVPENSVDFEKTKNLYIEGDNLDALKLLLKSYRGQVKCIYIDPPYNTGKDFIYRDDFKADDQEFALENGDVDDVGNRMVQNKETDGRYHTNWLNMMYPRLILARDLLAEDGVIFISIDDHEVENLKKICDEIFGGDNLVIQIAWRRTDNQSNKGNVARVKDYILCYAKFKNLTTLGKMPLSKKARKEYRYSDEKGCFRRAILLDKTRGRYSYSVTTKSGKTLQGPWMKKEDEFRRLDAAGLVYWTSGGDEQPYGKIYLDENKGQVPCDFWDIKFGTNQRASKDIEELFDCRIFEFTKPVSLLYHIARLGAKSPDSIVLDFFSGSATTAHAVMQLNAEDGGQRQFIMVQLPEACAPDSTAYQAGYQNICQIGEERIRRAGAKIKAENPLIADKLDTGFRVLRIDSSNINESIYQFPQDLQQGELEDQLYIKEGRTPEDLLFQTILNLGLPLSVEYTVENLNGQRVFNVGSDHLIACFDDSLSLKTVTAIAQKTPNYAIFLDSAMDDSLLANIEQVFKTYSAGTDWKVL